MKQNIANEVRIRNVRNESSDNSRYETVSKELTVQGVGYGHAGAMAAGQGLRRKTRQEEEAPASEQEQPQTIEREWTDGK